jgi:hypothetical protein
MMAKLDPIATLQIAGIVAAGVAAYLIVTKIAKTGAKVGDAVAAVASDVKDTVVNTVTKTLNPASTENIVHKTLTSTPAGESISEKIGNWMGKTFDPEGYAKYQENLGKIAVTNGGSSNVQNQGQTAMNTKVPAGTWKNPMQRGDTSYYDAQDNYQKPLTF